MSYLPRIVSLIRRRALAYELLDEYDADNLPFDSERYARGVEAIAAHSLSAAWKAGCGAGKDRWEAAVRDAASRYPSSR